MLMELITKVIGCVDRYYKQIFIGFYMFALKKKNSISLIIWHMNKLLLYSINSVILMFYFLALPKSPEFQ